MAVCKPGLKFILKKCCACFDECKVKIMKLLNIEMKFYE